jgi:hypothetical protein
MARGAIARQPERIRQHFRQYTCTICQSMCYPYQKSYAGAFNIWLDNPYGKSNLSCHARD